MKNCKLGFVAAIGLFTFNAHAQNLDSSAVGLLGLPAPTHEVTVAESEEKKLLSASTQKPAINPLMPTLSGDALPPTVQSHVMESVNKQPKKPAVESK
jgi:hypothetical protein